VTPAVPDGAWGRSHSDAWVGCTANPGRGDYLCGFTHGFPAALHHSGTGHAHFTVAPADRVGWYMTVLNDCS